jgi:ATP-binding cassette subfamily E protein 1
LCSALCLTPSYLFDEPSSYLDVKQRLKAALAIRNVIGDISNLKQKYDVHHLFYFCFHLLIYFVFKQLISFVFALLTLSYVIVVEHDLSVLDYLSDYICVLWGLPGMASYPPLFSLLFALN